MDFLKLIEASLSRNRDAIGRLLNLDNQEVYNRVQRYIKVNTQQWREEVPKIDYSNPICRLAYIYMNVPMHAYLIEQILADCSTDLSRLFQTDQTINVCCLGGGPGSELIGFTSYLMKYKRGQQFDIDFLLIDLIKEWDEYWHSLKSTVDEYQRLQFGSRKTWPVNISRSFIPLDSLKLDDFTNFPLRLAGINMFIFSYLISEVKSEIENFFRVLDYLKSITSDTTLFLFIDRDQKEISNTLKLHLLAKDFKILKEKAHLRGKADFLLNDLGDWYVKLESLPRRNYQAFFQLAAK